MISMILISLVFHYFFVTGIALLLCSMCDFMDVDRCRKVGILHGRGCTCCFFHCRTDIHDCLSCSLSVASEDHRRCGPPRQIQRSSSKDLSEAFTVRQESNHGIEFESTYLVAVEDDKTLVEDHVDSSR